MTSELIEFDRSRQPTDKLNAQHRNCRESCSSTTKEDLAIQHILAPFDGSAIAECTVPFVAAVAPALSARVTLLHVLERQNGDAPPDALEWEIARAEAFAKLRRLQSILEADGCTVAIEIVQGRAAEQIAHFTNHDRVDLIVLSSHGEGSLHGWNVAGTVHKVVSTTHASVLVVPAHRYQASQHLSVEFRKMLLPLDGSSRAECILPAATELAKAYDAELVLAHVVIEPEIPRRLPPSDGDVELVEKLIERNRAEATQYLRELQTRLSAAGCKVSVRVVVSSRRADALRDLAKEDQVDLVVLCAHGSTADPKQRYGEVAAKYLQQSDEPVIILQDLAAIVQPTAIPAVGQERPGH